MCLEMTDFVRESAVECYLALYNEEELVYSWGSGAFESLKKDLAQDDVFAQTLLDRAVAQLKTVDTVRKYPLTCGWTRAAPTGRFGVTTQVPSSTWWINIQKVDLCRWVGQKAYISLYCAGRDHEISFVPEHHQLGRELYQHLMDTLHGRRQIHVIRLPQPGLVVEIQLNAVLRELPNAELRCLGIRESDNSIRAPNDREYVKLCEMGIPYEPEPSTVRV